MKATVYYIIGETGGAFEIDGETIEELHVSAIIETAKLGAYKYWHTIPDS